MSRIVLFLLITVGCVIGAPILQELLQYHVGECIETEDGTNSKYVLEVINGNETCIQVNQPSENGDEIHMFNVPESDASVQIQIKVDNCTITLPEIHLSFCGQQHLNHTDSTVILDYGNVTTIESVYNDTTTEIMVSTDMTTVEIGFHHIHHDSDEEDEDD